MKQYDRDQKKWVPEEELMRKLKKRALCRGGQEHDWHDSLPNGVEHDNPTPEVIATYYAMDEEYIRAILKHETLLQEMGFRSRFRLSWHMEGRHQICHRCGKKRFKRNS